MSEYYTELAEQVREHFEDSILDCKVATGELTITVDKANLLKVCKSLRDHGEFKCDELIDVCGVDYLDYVDGQWDGQRFAVAYHLLSVSLNHRIRVKVFVDGEPPIVDSVIEIWNSADWFERETFDMFGIVFEGHPDLRRILTDYGFIGHPFRKDFPLVGNVEMRYDADKKRVVYQPVTIDPRINQPRVIRDDFRYAGREQHPEEKTDA
ncbi:MAG: NADH-quinone oxidoreductase subunit C [Gammaproteobacteria bacterium]|nr:NADH-quinone oxidoreductase subunit C [Gammaproteobacteria bacterium]